MKKILLLLIITTYPFLAKGFEVKIIHSPEVKSGFNGIVIIPSETTPYEFTGFIEEKLKENTGLELINRVAFAEFLKRQKIGEKSISSRDLIKIYKGFGSINIIFLNLKKLAIRKDMSQKAPCKKGIISFTISLYHSRNGLIIKNRQIEFELTLCSRTPLYPETKEIVEKLFDYATNEILKLVWPWTETIKLPDINNNICKNKEVIRYILSNNLKKAEQIISGDRQCYNRHKKQATILKAYIEFFKGNIDTSKELLKNLNRENKDRELLKTISMLEELDKKTIAGMAIVKKDNPVNKEKENIPYAKHYKNSADLLLEKLKELEELYNKGKISKQEYMEQKYKVIEQF